MVGFPYMLIERLFSHLHIIKYAAQGQVTSLLQVKKVKSMKHEGGDGIQKKLMKEKNRIILD